jgi:hypothetical protein
MGVGNIVGAEGAGVGEGMVEAREGVGAWGEALRRGLSSYFKRKFRISSWAVRCGRPELRAAVGAWVGVGRILSSYAKSQSWVSS